MNLTLIRKDRTRDGVFSLGFDDSGEQVFVALEHAYADGSGGWSAKIPNGTYTCVRGKHRLHGMDEDFETFEVTGIDGHSGLLFHWGNWNKDSDGCILVGTSLDGVMITMSRAAFAKFMAMQDGVDEFQLTVEG